MDALLFELVLNEENNDAMTAISIVGEPAILKNFMKFSEEQKQLQFAVNEDKMIITGPVLIPNVKIYRTADSLGLDKDAYVYFSEETCRKLLANFLGNLRNNNNTLEHREGTDKLSLIEAWAVDDPKMDKSTALGFDLPKGSIMFSYKVNDQDLWDDIKEGEYNGFSIEAALSLIPRGELHMSILESQEDTRVVLDKELHKPVLDWLTQRGQSQEDFENEGWILVSQDGELTEFGESLAVTMAIESNPDQNSTLDTSKYAIRYKYMGPRDDKNREFCANVLDANQIYRKEDIMQGTNPEFGTYNIFWYKGSYNCRHRWARLVFVKSEEGDLTRLPGSSALPDSAIPADRRATSKNTPVS